MRPYIIFVLSWLFPGSGHMIQKKWFKGVAFLSGTILLLVLGILMEGRLYSTTPFHPLLMLGFVGDLGCGIFFPLIKILGLAAGNIKSVSFHYGTTFLATAGLINYLVALNAFDIAKGRRP